MTSRTANLICLVIVVLATVASAYFYPSLPEQVPIHWNAAGEVDGYGSKLMGALFGPGLALFTWGMIWVIPKISPKGFGTGEFSDVLQIIQVALVAFMAGIGAMILMAGLGHQPSVEHIVPIAVGALLVLLGNYMGKVRKNFFVGIRTPWTLASDEVWSRTHRLAGYLFVAAGLGMIVSGLFEAKVILMAGLPLVAALVPVAYSYFAYRKLEGFDHDATS